MALTLTIGAKAFFDATIEEDIADIGGPFEDIREEIAARGSRPFEIPDFVPLPGHLRYRRGIRRFERLIYRIIDERRTSGRYGDDFLSRLMTARDDDGEPMSDTLLRDEAFTMIAAGHDTTALAVCWSAYLLGQHADLRKR
jgi:cytochrome P450